MPRRGIETTLKINRRSSANTPQTPRAEALDERGRGGTASVSTTGPPHRRTGENINSLPCVLPLARGNNLGCVTVRTKLTRGLKAPVSQTVSIQCEGHTHDSSVQRHFHHLGCRNAAWKLTPDFLFPRRAWATGDRRAYFFRGVRSSMSCAFGVSRGKRWIPLSSLKSMSLIETLRTRRLSWVW